MEGFDKSVWNRERENVCVCVCVSEWEGQNLASFVTDRHKYWHTHTDNMKIKTAGKKERITSLKQEESSEHFNFRNKNRKRI